jgi:uncharacterized protein YmfQ (DUF2313 family)
MDRPNLDIIKSPAAERMRQMVTAGFYDRSRIGLWLFEVMGQEYDDMAKWAQELRYEAFPQTCTWSITFWEFVYGYEPDDNLTLEQRRARLLAHVWSHPPINPARIEEALSLLTGTAVRIIENVAPYTFRVVFDESGLHDVDWKSPDYRSALLHLRRIKPSHLSFNAESIVENELVEIVLMMGIIAFNISTKTFPLFRPDFLLEQKLIIGGSRFGSYTITKLPRQTPNKEFATNFKAASRAWTVTTIKLPNRTDSKLSQFLIMDDTTIEQGYLIMDTGETVPMQLQEAQNNG